MGLRVSTRRNDPPRGLIRAGGVVREPRPGEGPTPKNVDQEKIEREKAEETVPSGEGIPRPEAARDRNARRRSLLTQSGISFLARGVRAGAQGRRERHSSKRRPSKNSKRRSWPSAGWNGLMRAGSWHWLASIRANPSRSMPWAGWWQTGSPRPRRSKPPKS